MKNGKPFLAALRENLSSSGMPVEIAGLEMLVIQPTQSTYRELLITAEDRARDELENKEEELRKKKLSLQEKKSLRKQFKTLGGDLPTLETEYDRDLFTRRMLHYSKLLISETVRYKDGSKTWETEEERFEISDLILATPGAEETIQTALSDLQKKRVKDQSTTSQKKRSSE